MAKQCEHNNQLRDVVLLPTIDVDSDDNDDVFEVKKTHAQKGGNKIIGGKDKEKVKCMMKHAWDNLHLSKKNLQELKKGTKDK